MRNPLPHDLVWVAQSAALTEDTDRPDWVAEQWNTTLPLVVRRAYSVAGNVAVGVRGQQRLQRHAAWLTKKDIVRLQSPEQIVQAFTAQSPTADEPAPLQALRQLAEFPWLWPWGVTGSAAYSLATGHMVLHDDSDLDLLVRVPNRVKPELLARFAAHCQALPCRVDVQLETPCGGCALNEWLRGGKVMVKSATGPYLTSDPWAC